PIARRSSERARKAEPRAVARRTRRIVGNGRARGRLHPPRTKKAPAFPPRPLRTTRAPSSAARSVVLDERPQLLAPRRMPQLPQRLRLDLADALARDLEVLTDLFERVVALLADAEAHAEDLLLARRQRLEHAPRLLLEVHVD